MTTEAVLSQGLSGELFKVIGTPNTYRNKGKNQKPHGQVIWNSAYHQLTGSGGEPMVSGSMRQAQCVRLNAKVDRNTAFIGYASPASTRTLEKYPTSSLKEEADHGMHACWLLRRTTETASVRERSILSLTRLKKAARSAAFPYHTGEHRLPASD